MYEAHTTPPDPSLLDTMIRVFEAGQRVILDADLARLYGVPTSQLNEQVSRNRERFPEDFTYQL